MLLPPDQFSALIQTPNMKLVAKGKKRLMKGRLLKFFDIMTLCTCFEFWGPGLIWSTTTLTKYGHAPCFGKTEMVRQRFYEIWSNLTFSDQPEQRPNDMSSDTFRWQLVNDFVQRFNVHR
jgi:hypothetical protein